MATLVLSLSKEAAFVSAFRTRPLTASKTGSSSGFLQQQRWLEVAAAAQGDDDSDDVADKWGSGDDDDDEEEERKPRWEKKAKSPFERRRVKVRPMPPGMKAYTLGEGYAKNAIPFSGIAPKTNRYRSGRTLEEAQMMIEHAKDVLRQKKEEAAVLQRGVVMQALPVPADQLQLLLDSGWLDDMRSLTVCNIVVEPEMEDAEGIRWQHVEIVGPEEDVRESSLKIMAALVPKRAALPGPEPRKLLK